MGGRGRAVTGEQVVLLVIALVVLLVFVILWAVSPPIRGGSS